MMRRKDERVREGGREGEDRERDDGRRSEGERAREQ